MRMPSTAEDGSRELVSLLAAIGVDDTALPPALIFKESSGDIRSSLMQHLDDKKQQRYFGASENGWSSDAFARTWLTHVFHEHTKSKAGRKKRLLILDGHGSHVNIDFVNLANKHRIAIAVLPPHSRHRASAFRRGYLFATGEGVFKATRRVDSVDPQFLLRKKEQLLASHVATQHQPYLETNTVSGIKME